VKDDSDVFIFKRQSKPLSTVYATTFSQLDQLTEECLEVEKLEQDLLQMVGKLVLIFVFIFLGLARKRERGCQDKFKRVDSQKKLQYL